MSNLITFNLKERGRQHRGMPRDYDIPKLVECINGPTTQERVKHRDMHGYYGHWPRLVFGPEPREGGIVEGKVVKIEPALVTTYLKAYSDGTVEHRSEFMETEPGKAVASLAASKAGGWSAVIDNKRPAFWGFDYVLEPNFTKNRAYALTLDSVGALADVTLDDVSAYYDSALEIVALMDGVNGENARLRRVVMHLEHQVMAAEDKVAAVLAGRDMELDSAQGYARAAAKKGRAHLLLDSAADLAVKAANAEGLRKPPVQTKPQEELGQSLLSRMFNGF